MSVAIQNNALRSAVRRMGLFALPLVIGLALFSWARWSYLLGAVADAPALIDLGRHENNQLVVTDVAIRNAGSKPLELSKFRSSCPSCIIFGLPSDTGLIEVDRLTVPPRESVTLAVRVFVHGTPEHPCRAAILCATNDPHRPELSIGFEAAVKGWVFPSPRELDLGVLKPGQTVRRTIEILDSGRGEPCRFGRLQSPAPDRVQLTLSLAGNAPQTVSGRELMGTLEVRITAPLVAWELDDRILVYEEGRDQPLLTVPIRGRVLPKVQVSPASIVLPRMVHETPDFTAECTLSSPAGRPLKATPTDLPAAIVVTPLDRDAAKDRAGYRLEWRAEHRPPPGETRSAMIHFRVEVDGQVEVVNVPVRCRLDAPTTKESSP
jgi:hypothetical protein